MLDDRLCNIPTMIQIQFVTCFPFFTWTNALNFAFKWLYNSWLLLIIGLLWSFGNNQIMPYLVSSSLLLSLCKVIREKPGFFARNRGDAPVVPGRSAKRHTRLGAHAVGGRTGTGSDGTPPLVSSRPAQCSAAGGSAGTGGQPAENRLVSASDP